VQRDVEQPALAALVDRRQAGDRCRHAAVAADQAQTPRLLADQHQAAVREVGQEGERPGALEAVGDDRGAQRLDRQLGGPHGDDDRQAHQQAGGESCGEAGQRDVHRGGL